MPVNDLAYAPEVEILANERFAAVGGAVLAALAESGLSARRAANVLSWFVVAQLALGPWRSRGEVRPAALAARMRVSRWTEWRARRDAVAAGVVRDWTLPDPEARGYGRGRRPGGRARLCTHPAPRPEKWRPSQEERASRAQRRREARSRAKRGTRVATQATPTVESAAAPTPPVRREELTSPAAGRLWEMVRHLQPTPAANGSPLPRSHPPPG